MYSIEIKMKYGKFKVKSDNYQECMNKYKEIEDDSIHFFKLEN